MSGQRATFNEGTNLNDQDGYSKNKLIATSNHILAADMLDRNFFTAPFPCHVDSIQYVATTPESAGTLTFIVRRCQAVEAPASGDALMTAANAVGAALVTMTVYTATLTETAALLYLNAGDRLAIDFTDDTAGELAGLSVTVTLSPA